jgi:hypothetical protein
VSLGDSIRNFFAKRSNPKLEELELFISARKGVEGYIEPRTATQPTTLLLVDRDGDHVRGPVRDHRQATAFCNQHSIPVYDAAVIGYPRRMRDFESGRRGGSQSLDEQIADIERRLGEPGPPE